MLFTGLISCYVWAFIFVLGLSNMSQYVLYRVRTPGDKTVTYRCPPGTTAEAILKDVVAQCSLSTESDWNLCQSPSAGSSGQVLRPEQVPLADFNALTVNKLLISLTMLKETFFVCSQPLYILVQMIDEGTKTMPKRILLDADQPLGSLLPLISSCFKLNSKQGYAFVHSKKLQVSLMK